MWTDRIGQERSVVGGGTTNQSEARHHVFGEGGELEREMERESHDFSRWPWVEKPLWPLTSHQEEGTVSRSRHPFLCRAVMHTCHVSEFHRRLLGRAGRPETGPTARVRR